MRRSLSAEAQSRISLVQSQSAFGASAIAPYAVALGACSIANQANTFSVVSAKNQRRITNVANGIASSDALTFGQLARTVSSLTATKRLLR